jgi:hypothetical protein
VVPGSALAVSTPPTGLSPNDPTSAPSSPVSPTTVHKNVELRWNPVAGASTYDVQLTDENGNFTNAPISTSFPRYATPVTLPRGDYGWRVRTSGGDWSSTAWFTRGWAASPGNPEAVADKGPVLTWDAMPDASYYEVQFSATPFIKTPYGDSGSGNVFGDGEGSSCFTAATTLTPYAVTVGEDIAAVESEVRCKELVGGPFYWRVRGRDSTVDTRDSGVTAPAAGCTGVWYYKNRSATEPTPECSAWAYPDVPSFTSMPWADVTLPTPATPTGLDISPRVGANTNPVSVTGSPTFSWNEVPGTSFYRVYMSRTADMDTLDYTWETAASAMAPIFQRADRANRMFWSVQACVISETDLDGFVLNYAASETTFVACSDPTTPRSFIKQSLAEAQPAGTSIASGGTTFTWMTALDGTKPNGGTEVRSAEARAYQVQVSDVRGNFANPSRTYATDRIGNVNGRSSYTVATSSLPNGYRWRVRSFDQTGNFAPWSSAVQVGALAASTGRIVSNAGFEGREALTIRFDGAVNGAGNGTVRVIATSTGATVPGSVGRLNAANYRFIPARAWVPGESYRLWVASSVKDAATGATVKFATGPLRATTVVDSSSAALVKTKGDYAWKSARGSDALGGTYLRSNDKKKTTKRSAVSVSVRASSVAVLACRNPFSGRAGIWVNGKLVKKVSLYKKAAKCGVVTRVSLPAGKVSTVAFKPMGSKVKKSKAKTVRFDGFRLS